MSYKWQIRRNQMEKARMYGGNYGAYTDKEGRSWLQQQRDRDPNFIRNSDQSQWGRDAYYHWKDQERGGGDRRLPTVQDMPQKGATVTPTMMPDRYKSGDYGLITKNPQFKTTNLPTTPQTGNLSGLSIGRTRANEQPGVYNFQFANEDQVLGGQAGWTDQTVEDRASMLKDPNFYKNGDITKYDPATQQEILKDPNFDWKQVPGWQRAYYEVSSRPAAMGAVQGGLMGMTGGPVGGAIGGTMGAGFGAVAAKTGYDQTKEWWQQGDQKWTWDKQQVKDNVNAGMGLLNWLAEGAEKAVGTSVQIGGILTGNDPNFDPTKRNLDLQFNKDFSLKPGEDFNPNLVTGSTWEAGAGVFEAMAPAVAESMRQHGLLDNIFEGKAPTEEELHRISRNVSGLGLPQLYDLFKSPEKYKGTEYYLGAADPIAVEQTIYEKLTEAKERIAAGENYRQVMTDMQTGILAQVGDMVGQAAADPLNVMPDVTTKVGGKIAEAGGNKVAAQALNTSEGLVEAAGKYKTLVQTGMATTIDPNFKVSDMSGVSRFIAGINSQGEVKAGNIFGGKAGLLDPTTARRQGVVGFVQDLARQTPQSRAQQGAGMFYENIGAFLSAIEDPHDAAKYLGALAKNDNATWAELGSRFADSPEFYTVLPALKAFASEKLQGITQSWDLAQGNRDMLTRLSDVLGEEPARLLEDLGRNGTADQDFTRIVERLKQSTDPQAKAMLADVEAGKFTADTLKQTVDIFTGDGALAWHPAQWKAQMMDALGEHFDTWVTDRLMLDKTPEAKSAFFRTTAMLKQAQSILLLGGSPGYALTNGMSNMVHRAATGIYGYMTPNQINGFMDRMGFSPSRLEEGVGIGGQVEMASGKSGVKMDAMTDAVKGKGPLTTAKKALGKISSGMPFSKLSSWFESNESKQAFAIGMKQMWSQSWRRGVGFSKMTPELTQAISGLGIDPNRIYAAIEAGMNQAEIEKALFSRSEGVQARSLVHDAAQKSGMSASQAADMLDKIGVLDQLDSRLKGRTTADGIRGAFESVRKQARDWADMQTGEDLKAIAESVKQKVGMEGAPAALDVVQKAHGAFTDAWLDHYSRFGEVMNDLKLLDDPAQRSKAIELSYKQSDEEFRRVYARHAANYKGIFEAWGMSGNPDALKLLEGIGEVDNAMRNAYAQMRELRGGFFEKWRDDMGNPASYDEWQANSRKIDTLFEKAFEIKRNAEKQQGAALAGIYEKMYNAAAGEAARQWWEEVVAFNDEMVQRERDFRKSLEDMDADEKRIAKQEFYQKDKVGMIVESDRINGEGIARLERAIKGGGGGTESGRPTPPSQPPTDQQRVKQIKEAETKEKQAQRDRVEEFNALTAAAEQRKTGEAAAQAERLTSIWDMAEGYAREGMAYDRTILQDKFALLGALGKAEYGGIPDLKGMNDPRLTPELVKEVLERRQAVKEAAAGQRVGEAIQSAENAAVNAKALKIDENTPVLKAIAEHGGLEITRARDITGDKRNNSRFGTFKKGGWDITDMARMLADDGYPIDMNAPDDPGGVGQATSLIQRALNKEKVYPVGHDYEAALAKAQNEAAEKAFTESMQDDIYPFDETNWQGQFEQAVKAGDLDNVADLIGNFPEDLNRSLSPTGETWEAYMSRQWDETAARVESTTREQMVAEQAARADQTIIEQETRAEAVTTRQLMKEKFQEAFRLTDQQAEGWMELSNSLADWYARTTGESADGFYSRYYEGVERGGADLNPLDGLKQAYSRIEVAERSMTRADAENYARMLVRGGEGELRAAIRNEGNKADRIAILDEVHKMDPKLAENVARGEMDVLFQEAYHGSPYKFDKFTLDHMGTGEGAQVYGWGLYFAGNKEVANFYREGLTSKKLPAMPQAGEFQNGGYFYKIMRDDLDGKVTDYVKASPNQPYADGTRISQNEYSKAFQDAQAEYDKLDKTGQLYAVEIPDDNYLLWDKPLSEQNISIEPILDAIANTAKDYRTASRLASEDVRGRLTAYFNQPDVPANTFYRGLADELGSDKAASLALREAGINGIQYLDGSSRGKGEGNYNFVIFDENAIKVKETFYQDAQVSHPIDNLNPVEESLLRGEQVAPEELSKHPFLQSAFDAKTQEYPTKGITIAKAKNLTPAQRVVEARFAQAINDDLPGMIDRYWQERKPGEGNVLNVDYARDLSADYMGDKMNYASAVQKPASALVRRMWEQKLAEPLTGAYDYDRVVFFSAGVHEANQSAHVVWDMTLSESKDLAYIDQALKTDRAADVVFVARDPIDALLGIADRAKVEGRVVPIDSWAEAHSGAPETFRQAISKYGSDNRVTLNAIDNTRGFGNAAIVPLEFVNDRVYNRNELRQAGIESLRKGVQDGKVEENIYRAISGDEPSRKGGIHESPDARGTKEITAGSTNRAEPGNAIRDGGQPEQQRNTTPDQLGKEYQPGKNSPKGAVTFGADGIKATITAFESADFTTLVHENGHVFRRVLADVAERTGNAQIKADLATIEEWAGVRDGNWDRTAEEKFARGFENYVATGQAPLPKLRAAFETIRTWMLEIYKTITGSAIDVKVSDDVRAVFDRMLGGENSNQLSVDSGRFDAGADVAARLRQGGQTDIKALNETRLSYRKQARENSRALLEAETPELQARYQQAAADFTQMEKAVEGYIKELKSAPMVERKLEGVKSGQPVESLFQRAEPVETPAFKNWFGESKVVDENGRPLVVYHGTDNIRETTRTFPPEHEKWVSAMDKKYGDNWNSSTLDKEDMKTLLSWEPIDTTTESPNNIQIFDRKLLGENTLENAGTVWAGSTSLLGFWFNSESMMSKKSPYDMEISAYMSLKNPLEVDSLDDLFYIMKEKIDPNNKFHRSAGQFELEDAGINVRNRVNKLVLELKRQGYDGIVVRGDEEFGGTSFVAFDSKQIKSTANRGTFDPKNPNILFQEADQPFGSYDGASQFRADSEVMDAGWAQSVEPLLKNMEEGAIQQLGERPLDGASRDMSPEGQKMLRGYMKKVQGEMATTKLATVRHAEQKRDFAMLNYSRRYGFDRWADAIFPYQFYQSRTMVNWAARALDKPAYFSNYARLHNQMNRYERDIPERLRNKIRIPAPWLPEWAGDGLYIDPIGGLFPPATLLKPFERMNMQYTQQQQEAQRILQEWAGEGSTQYSDADIQQAFQSMSGPAWERAFAEAQIRRESEVNNPLDFFSTMFGPAWYLTTPMKLATGKGGEITGTPLGRTSRAVETVTKGTAAEGIGQVFGLLGKAEDWTKKKLNIPEFGEYGDYYVDRQLANMVADGVIDAEQAQIAMVERQGEIFDQARERVRMEEAMRVPLAGTLYAGLHDGAKGAAQAALPSLFGAGLLPSGELEYRGLKQEWNEAWKRRDGGDKNAITDFFEEHPEYEAYLAKGKPPEERLKSFLIGQIWDGYMELGETNQKAARGQMGELFQQSFLDKETRSYDVLDTDTLTQWAQMLGQMTPKVQPSQQVSESAIQQQQPTAPKLDLFSPEVTQITDQFFSQRREKFPNYYQVQQGYYALATRGEKATYLAEHPELKEYWNWKDNWYNAYPEYKPVLNGNAFKQVDTSGWVTGLEGYVRDYAFTGGRMPNGAYKALEQVWYSEGMPMGDYQTWLDSQVVPAMMYGNQ